MLSKNFRTNTNKLNRKKKTLIIIGLLMDKTSLFRSDNDHMNFIELIQLSNFFLMNSDCEGRLQTCAFQWTIWREPLLGSGKEWTAREAVQLWVDEKQFYNNTTNTCATGKVCGHYTQVVWRNSVNLGCARVKCNSGAIFITSNYSPRGNIVGQRPY
ncbi:unnamed protein product [Spirodela intermedia]|uniref:SCP domain-containing protein n=1 Tax=Spirodela intermedia TaxID=51605 RepID=A0A7I8IIG6_SPIIN|nr:unnamed protein product [Spirodela intermedia]CAA6657665.1 unnamed protein product [Spirodela intermedia]